MEIQWLYVIVGVNLASTWDRSNYVGNDKVEIGADVGFAIGQRLRPSCHSGGARVGVAGQ